MKTLYQPHRFIHGLSLAICGLLLSANLSSPALAGGITWKYQTTYNSSTGVPSGLTNQSTFGSLASKAIALLPEGVNNSNKGLLTNDLGGNVYLLADANIKLVFIYENAGYQNAIGYFTFPSASLSGVAAKTTPISDTIVFPNFSSANSGGYLRNGDTVNLGTFKAGQAIGITLVANGWANGNGYVNPNVSVNNIFRTITELNPETPSTSNLQSHTVLLSDTNTNMLVVGIEDLNRQPPSSVNPYGYSPDHDFNDAVVGIQVTPLNGGTLSSTVDLSHVYTINGDPPSMVTTPTTPLPSYTATGQTGPVSWREVCLSNSVNDPIKAAKAAAKIAP